MKFVSTLVLALVAVCGCKSASVQGGSALHDNGSLAILYTPDGKVSIADSRERIATTQPSFSSTNDKANLTTKTADEGDIGGFTFKTENFKQSPTAWGLIAILLGCGIWCYITHKWVGVILCGAGVVIAFIAPSVLVWFAVAGVAYVIFINRAYIKQLVAGNQMVLDSMPPVAAETAKATMAEAHDQPLQKMVKDIKAKLPAAKPRVSPQVIV